MQNWIVSLLLVSLLLPPAAVAAADIQLNPVKALVHNISSVSCGVDFTVWLSKEGEASLRPSHAAEVWGFGMGGGCRGCSSVQHQQRVLQRGLLRHTQTCTCSYCFAGVLLLLLVLHVV